MHGLPKAGMLAVICRGEGGAPRVINCMWRVIISVLPKAGVLVAIYGVKVGTLDLMRCNSK